MDIEVADLEVESLIDESNNLFVSERLWINLEDNLGMHRGTERKILSGYGIRGGICTED
jgi:hypothetical protein